MSISQDGIAFVHELFAGLGTLTHRKMMGGATFYYDGQVFAIISSNGDIYLKAKGAFADEMKDAGSRIFGMNGRTMGYWTLPESALDDAELACDWARRALSELT